MLTTKHSGKRKVKIRVRSVPRSEYKLPKESDTYLEKDAFINGSDNKDRVMEAAHEIAKLI